MRFKKTITLIELIVAITLMGVIILGAAAFDLASRRFFVSTGEDIALLNELGMVLDHINRNVSQATGDAANPGIRWDAASHTLRIRIDRNAIPDPDNYLSHTWVEYVFTGNQITYQVGNGPVTTLTDRLTAIPTITTCCDTPNCPPNISPTCLCPVNDAVCLLTGPQGGVRMSGLSLTNGNFVVSIDDTTDPHSDTIYFFPLSHSWN